MKLVVDLAMIAKKLLSSSCWAGFCGSGNDGMRLDGWSDLIITGISNIQADLTLQSSRCWPDGPDDALRLVSWMI